MLSQLVCKRWYSLIQSVDTTINTVPTFPALMGPPSVGEHSSKRYTTVVDRKFIPHMPAVLLQIKFLSKGHWTCRQSIPCVHMTLESQTSSPPPTPCPLPQLPFFISLSIFYGLTARERCEMVHEDSWWHIISVLIRPCFLLGIWSLQHVADVRWYMVYIMVAYHFCIDHWTLSPLFGTIIYRIYYNII